MLVVHSMETFVWETTIVRSTGSKTTGETFDLETISVAKSETDALIKDALVGLTPPQSYTDKRGPSHFIYSNIVFRSIEDNAYIFQFWEGMFWFGFDVLILISNGF